MGASIPHITVCICTFKRPLLLRRLLDALQQQDTANKFTISAVVADNDAEESARATVTEFGTASNLSVVYCVEPRKNIALVRNKSLEAAKGEYVAFIDDDEFPTNDWLKELLTTCQRSRFAAVLGPVRPFFENPPPKWIIRGRFCERPEYPTGRLMPWEECRTGNVLIDRSTIEGLPAPFDAAFGNGGEDKDFFMHLANRGFKFVWCNEAPVFEVVPPERWTRSYMLRRALLRGKNILKHPSGKVRLLARSLAAVPLYLFAIPVCLAFGQHVCMKYLIKLCDHLGRLLAIARLNPVNER